MRGNNNVPAAGFGVEGDSGFTVSFQGGVEREPMGTIALTTGNDRVCCRFDKLSAAGLNHQTIRRFFYLKLCPQQRPTRQNAQARNATTKDRLPVVDVGRIGREKGNLLVVYCQNRDSHVFGNGNVLMGILRDDIGLHKDCLIKLQPSA